MGQRATKEQQANIHAGLRTGETYAQIAERCGVKRWTGSYYARSNGIKRTRGWKVTGWPSPLISCYLELRGMGDLFGERQSGVPTFKVADPLRDTELSDLARAAAERLLAEDPTLGRPEHKRMQETLRRQFGRALELFRVG